MVAVGQIRQPGGGSSQFGKDIVGQTGSRFLPDPFPEMETETKALTSSLRTVIYTCVCVPVYSAVFKRVGSKNIRCYVMWAAGIRVCIANEIVVRARTFNDR